MKRFYNPHKGALYGGPIHVFYMRPLHQSTRSTTSPVPISRPLGLGKHGATQLQSFFTPPRHTASVPSRSSRSVHWPSMARHLGRLDVMAVMAPGDRPVTWKVGLIVDQGSRLRPPNVGGRGGVPFDRDCWLSLPKYQ